MAIRYGQTVTWTRFDGRKETIEVSDCDTAEEASRLAFDFARRAGWTPPRWWQWWRWHDTPAPADCCGA